MAANDSIKSKVNLAVDYRHNVSNQLNILNINIKPPVACIWRLATAGQTINLMANTG